MARSEAREPLRILKAARTELRSEPRVAPDYSKIHVALEGETLILEGEVASIAVKKLALERVAAVPGFSGIVDRLRVAPAQRMADGEIRVLVRDALLQEPAFLDCALRERVGGELKTVREPTAPARGEFWISVADGVVTLDGRAPSLAHKRLAGVLAWWAPGSRDVVNGVEVVPPEEDSDDEITDAVRLALEKDPFVDAAQVRVTTRGSVVILDGVVPTEEEREMAEFDAWSVFGVDGVANRVGVRS